MFLHLLNDDQKAAFFDMAAEMLAADGEADDAEIAYMDQLINEAGLVKRRALHDPREPMELTVFDTAEAKHAVVLELLILSVIDGHYHVKEAAYANTVIDKLEIDEDTHEALCRLTNDAVNLMHGMRDLAGGVST